HRPFRALPQCARGDRARRGRRVLRHAGRNALGAARASARALRGGAPAPGAGIRVDAGDVLLSIRRRGARPRRRPGRVAAYDAAFPDGAELNWIEARRAQTYMHFGRFRAAAPLLDSLRSANSSLGLAATLIPILVGMIPDEFAASDIALLEAGVRAGAPPAVLFHATIALAQGDTARVRALLDGMPNAEEVSAS